MKLAVLVLATACGRLDFDAQTLRGDARTDGVATDGAPGDAPVDPSLILHFRFDPAQLAVNAIAGAPNAACSGNCPMETTRPNGGGAAHFDGTSCFYVPPYVAPDVFSFAVWAKPTSMANQTVFGKPFNAATDSKNTFEIWSGGNTDFNISFSVASASATLALNQWHHFAGTYDGTSMQIFFDGTLASQGAATLYGYTADPYMIGCDRDNAVDLARFNGDIDEVRLYNRVLDGSEIATLAAP